MLQGTRQQPSARDVEAQRAQAGRAAKAEAHGVRRQGRPDLESEMGCSHLAAVHRIGVTPKVGMMT